MCGRRCLGKYVYYDKALGWCVERTKNGLKLSCLLSWLRRWTNSGEGALWATVAGTCTAGEQRGRWWGTGRRSAPPTAHPRAEQPRAAKLNGIVPGAGFCFL